MPRVPRNPGSGKAPVNSPARSDRGSKSGEGWGGSAKGAGKPPGNKLAGRPTRDVAELIAAKREERLEKLKEHLLALAVTAEREETQLNATVAYLNREEGTPVARSQISGPDNGPMRIERVIIDSASD